MSAGEEVPVELLTGKPFVFDPDTRKLLLPEDELLESLEINIQIVPLTNKEMEHQDDF